MIRQFKVLQSVKKMREDRALRELMKAREDLRKAEERLQDAITAVEDSARTLPDRERAIYAEILRKIVGLPDIDSAKDRVLALQMDHQRLIDRRGRAEDHVKRMQEALVEAQAEYRRKQQEVEKIDTLLERMIREAAEEATAKEEAEIEELFSKPGKRPDTPAEGVLQ
ncbi:MAG: type III secretion system stalk subunit SctO [Paracoccaceae bacterium]